MQNISSAAACDRCLQGSKAGGRTSFVAAFAKITQVLKTVNKDHRAAEISIVFMTDGDDTVHQKVHGDFKSRASYHVFTETHHNQQSHHSHSLTHSLADYLPLRRIKLLRREQHSPRTYARSHSLSAWWCTPSDSPRNTTTPSWTCCVGRARKTGSFATPSGRLRGGLLPRNSLICSTGSKPRVKKLRFQNWRWDY